MLTAMNTSASATVPAVWKTADKRKRRVMCRASGRNVCLRALLYVEYARGHGDIKCASSILT